MKNYFFKTIVILFFIMTVTLNAQSSDFIQIGSGALIDQGLPWEPYYVYTYSQTIYYPSEIIIADGGLINGISYHFNGASQLNDTVEIYMGYTNNNTFSSSSSWIPFNQLTLVFNGTVICPAVNGWVYIPLDNEFTYSSDSNLVIAVREYQGGDYYPNANDFYCTTVTGNRSIVYRSDTVLPNPQNPPTASSTRSAIPNTRIYYEDSLFPKPRNLTAEIVNSTVTLNWDLPYNQLFTGFKVIRNNELIATLPGNQTTFVDFLSYTGIYTYSVSAVYEAGESDPRTIEIEVTSLSHYFNNVWSGNGYLHMVFFVYQAELEGVGLEQADEIAVFDGDYCVGSIKLISEINNYVTFPASMNDPFTDFYDGYTPGNNITFKIWKASSQTEYTLNGSEVEYLYGESVFGIGETSVVNLNKELLKTQNITLQSGWNIISSLIVKENADMLNIFNELIIRNSLTKVQSQNGYSVEYLTNIGWINYIGELNNHEGYRVHLSQSDILSLDGQYVSTPLNISLSTGWNIISYPFLNPASAMTIFEDIISLNALVKVQDESGNALEYLPQIGWVNLIGLFESGKGYAVRVNQDCTLYYQEPRSEPAMSVMKNQPNSDETSFYYNKNWTGNGWQHFNLYIKLNSDILIGDEIGIFDGEHCVGSTIYQGEEEYITLISSLNDPASCEINGYTSGNNYSLRIMSRQNQIEIINPDIEIISGNLFFEPGESALIRFKNLTATNNEVLPDVAEIYSIYPNPFNPVTNIKFRINQSNLTNLSIFNIRGQKVKTLTSESLETGEYQYSWNGKDEDNKNVSSGLYFIKLRSGSQQITKKVILLK